MNDTLTSTGKLKVAGSGITVATQEMGYIRNKNLEDLLVQVLNNPSPELINAVRNILEHIVNEEIDDTLK